MGQSENYCAEHSAKAVHGILTERIVSLACQVDKRVHLSDTGDDKFFGCLLSLLLDPFIVLLGQLGEAL